MSAGDVQDNGLTKDEYITHLEVEVVRLRVQRDEWRSTAEGFEASWDSLADEMTEVEAERDRLVDGIREHRLNYANPFASWTEREANERLWSLLDVAGDDREDG